MYRHLDDLDIPVELYAPFETPREKLQSEFLKRVPSNGPSPTTVRTEPAWVALAEIVSRVEKEVYRPPLGRIMFQKISYFATQAGIPTGLQFEKGSYGPWAPDLKKEMTQLVNNSILAESRSGARAQMFIVETGPTFQDAKKAHEQMLSKWSNLIERTVDLVLRLQNTRQAELAATVHYTAKKLGERQQDKPTETKVLDGVVNWKIRRDPPFNKPEIALAIRSLAMLGWLRVEASSNLPIPDEEFLPA